MAEDLDLQVLTKLEDYLGEINYRLKATDNYRTASELIQFRSFLLTAMNHSYNTPTNGNPVDGGSSGVTNSGTGSSSAIDQEISNTLTSINTRVNTLITNLNNIITLENTGNASLGSLDTKLTTSNASLADLTIDVASLLTSLGNINSALTTIANDLISVENELTPSVQVYRSNGVSDNSLLKTGNSHLYSLYATNVSGSTRNLHFFNLTRPPILNDIPVENYRMRANETLNFGRDFFSSSDISFPDGLAWGYSIGSAAFSAGGGAGIIIRIAYY